MENKKLLMFLALNSLASSFAGTEPLSDKYQKMYDSMIKNEKSDKTNEKNYRLIEETLKKRNKELQDLYLQGDYITKPEYLEWQIFFNTFTTNTKINGKQEKAVTYNEDRVKTVDFAMMLPIKEIKDKKVEVIPSPVQPPYIIPAISQINSMVVTSPTITYDDFVLPSGPAPMPVPYGTHRRTEDYEVGKLTSNVVYNTTGNSVFENLNVSSVAGTEIYVRSGTQTDVTGSANYVNGAYTGTSLATNTNIYTPSSFNTINIGNNGNFEISGNWIQKLDYYSGGVSSFLSYRPYYVNTNSTVVFSGDLQLVAESPNLGMIGLSLNPDNSLVNPAGKAVLENRGTITMGDAGNSLEFSRIIGMQLESGSWTSKNIESELINNGTIVMNSGVTLGAGINISMVGTGVTVPKALVKIGNINMKQSIARLDYTNASGVIFGGSSTGLVDSNIIVDGSGGLINMESKNAVGIKINRINKPQNAINGVENFKNLNLLLNGESQAGILRSTNSPDENTVDMIMTKDVISSIKFGPNSKTSAMFFSTKGTIVFDATLEDSIGVINEGKGNGIAFMGNGDLNYSSADIKIKNYMPVTIESGAEGMTVFSVHNGGTIENYADIINNSSSYVESGRTYGARALASYVNEAVMINYGNIDMNGKDAVAFYNGFLLNSESDHAVINNDNGIVVYSVPSNRGAGGIVSGESNVSANRLEVNGDNGVVAFSHGGNINLSPLVTGGTLELTANGLNTYAFYHQRGIYNWNIAGKIKINGTVNANVKNGGIGMHYTGNGITSSPVNLGTELGNIIDSSGGTLNIITDSDSYNLTLQNVSVNLSNLSNLNFDNVNFATQGKAKMYNSGVFIDIDSDIDKNNTLGNKIYRDTSIGASNITLNSGIKITGTENVLTAIAQDYSGVFRVGEIINRGEISLTGAKSTGIYGQIAKIENTGEINVTGKNNTAVYGADSSIKNTGIIKIGDEGVGIYSLIDPYYYTLRTVENDGKIEAKSGTKAVGIYSELDPTAAVMNYEVTLSANSDIDMKNSENAVGVYSKNRNVAGTNAGSISIGKDSYGVYVKDADVSLDNLTLNIVGDNSAGIYTEGTGSFSGSGTVNLDGKGIVVFNIESSGVYNQNFTVNSTSGSSYIFQNIKNRVLTSDNMVNLGEGGIYINAADSSVTLGINSDLDSFNAVTGSYDSGMIGVVSSGLAGNIVNKGDVSFGDNSAGLYAKDGGQILNEGSIRLGKNSVGLYGEGAGSNIVNDSLGEINIQDNSVGILLNNGNSIVNSGKIYGTSEKVTGIYSDSSNNAQIQINDDIILTGNKSTGVYLTGTGSQTFTNNAVIISGSSDSDKNPAIGVYNNGSTNKIINNSTIKTGDNSVGIYNNGGEVIQNSGSITAGENSVGIYTDSGKVSLLTGSMNITGENSVGIYGTNGAEIENNLNMSFADFSYGIISNSGTKIINNSGSVTLGENSVFIYSDGGTEILNKAGSDILITGSDSSGIYAVNGVNIENHGNISASTGAGNMGISSKGGNIFNTGNIETGDSIIVDEEKTFLNTYSVGIYGENVEDFKNTGNIETGYRGVGLYIKNNAGEALNSGDIKSSKEGAMGIYAEKSTVKNTGNITMSGNDSIGIAAAQKVTAVNSGIITMNGDNSIGIYANIGSKIVNEKTGIININGNNSTGVQLLGDSTLENYGQINMASGIYGSKDIATGEEGYTLPSIINAGVIMVDEKFEIDGINLTIKVDPDSLRLPTLNEVIMDSYSLEDVNAGFLISNAVSIKAPSFDLDNNTTKIDPYFTQGTNMRVYKFENVFDPSTPEGGPNTGEIAMESGSLTFDAIPVTNKNTGGVDIWMQKIDYNKFTQGTWYNKFSENIESGYFNATGDALKIYDRLDLIATPDALKHDFEQLAGNIYSNIMQREENIGDMFNNTLDILQNSENNTKENVKVGVITGMGSRDEKTSGVPDYDYNTYGVLGLREVERTYKHKFGYSLGYTQTNFEFDDSESKDKADTFQIGLHNKYSSNGWNFRNDFLGRMSIHNVDRSTVWSDGTNSELSSDYNVYGVSSLNSIGREIEIGGNLALEPYAGLELEYMVHSGFEEKDSIEKLKVKENDAYSIKPSVGLQVKAKKEIKDSGWQIKGNIGAAYGYELGNMNSQEKANVVNIEDGYHKLAKVSDDKGTLKVNVSAGIELKERYGIYVTGEYGMGNDDRNDYKAGITLKAVF